MVERWGGRLSPTSTTRHSHSSAGGGSGSNTAGGGGSSGGGGAATTSSKGVGGVAAAAAGGSSSSSSIGNGIGIGESSMPYSPFSTGSFASMRMAGGPKGLDKSSSARWSTLGGMRSGGADMGVAAASALKSMYLSYSQSNAQLSAHSVSPAHPRAARAAASAAAAAAAAASALTARVGPDSAAAAAADTGGAVKSLCLNNSDVEQLCVAMQKENVAVSTIDIIPIDPASRSCRNSSSTAGGVSNPRPSDSKELLRSSSSSGRHGHGASSSSGVVQSTVGPLEQDQQQRQQGHDSQLLRQDGGAAQQQHGQEYLHSEGGKEDGEEYVVWGMRFGTKDVWLFPGALNGKVPPPPPPPPPPPQPSHPWACITSRSGHSRGSSRRGSRGSRCSNGSSGGSSRSNSWAARGLSQLSRSKAGVMQSSRLGLGVGGSNVPDTFVRITAAARETDEDLRPKYMLDDDMWRYIYW